MLIQIVPRLPPPEEGVGGIALALAGALERHGIGTRFVVPAPYGAGARSAGLDVVEIAPNRAALVTALAGSPSGVVPRLLHYAGYGYEARGAPVWLAEGLAQVPGRLWTQFHEVWASGPPWRSSFWLGPRQRRIAGAIGDRSERISTSLDLYAGLLRSRLTEPNREITVLPVISAVGECAAPIPFDRRIRRLAVFGGPGLRGRAYRDHPAELEAAARMLAISEIWDLGPGDVAPGQVGPFPVRRLGALPATEVSAILAKTAAGFLAYPLGFLAKSSAFAAFAAHAVLPLCTGRTVTPREASPLGPLPGVHFWATKSTCPDPGAVATAAWTWYEGHSLAAQAAAVAAWVNYPVRDP